MSLRDNIHYCFELEIDDKSRIHPAERSYHVSPQTKVHLLDPKKTLK